MPIKQAAKKALRQTIKHNARNVEVKESLRKLIKNTRKSVLAKKADEAAQTLRAVVKALDKAAQKKIIKKNTAGRLKSRLTKKVNALIAK